MDILKQGDLVKVTDNGDGYRLGRLVGALYALSGFCVLVRMDDGEVIKARQIAHPSGSNTFFEPLIETLF